MRHPNLLRAPVIPTQSSPFTLHSLLLLPLSLPQTKQVHAQATTLGLLDLHLSSTLLLSYSSRLDSPSSLLVFLHSPFRSHSPFLWNSLIRAYHTHLSSPVSSLRLYNSMLGNGLRPDDRTFPFVLAACSAARSAVKGQEVHGSLSKLGFGSDVFVGNTLLSFYGVCGLLAETRKVFDEMLARDIVSWNSIISVFSANGLFSSAMRWFSELKKSGFRVNFVSFVSVLPACGAMKDGGFGMGIHGHTVKVGLDSVVNVGNALVDMYGKCGKSEDLVRVFEGMPQKNEVSWNSVIGGLVHAGIHGDALRMFRDMLACGQKPNSITVSSLLPALVALGWLNLGREIHGYCARTGMDFDVFVANSLVDMYAKSGCFKKGSDVFCKMDSKNVVSWNAMIANCAQNGAESEAIELVVDMQRNGECPNSVTFTNVLPACARIASLKKGREIHARSFRDGSYHDLFVSNALIDMYAKCGWLKLARNVFDISEVDQVSYNTLVVGYSQSSWASEALLLFKDMALVGIEHDAISFMGVLSACANLSALKHGKEIHCLSVKKLFSTHIFVANSLLDLYTKSGRIDLARKIFDRILNKDVASWNAMILGYGMLGEFNTAIELFDSMKDDDVKYDHVSYVAVLSACSHGGMLERGKKYFEQMLAQDIMPTQMHYACMVDNLGRSGLMKEAAEFIRGMPFEADSNVWGALLGACRVHGNIEIGRWAAEHLFELNPGHSGYFLLLSNMYAEAGRWEEANEIRVLMKSRRVKKSPACSWVEIDNKVRTFTVGERIEEPDVELCYAEPD